MIHIRNIINVFVFTMWTISIFAQSTSDGAVPVHTNNHGIPSAPINPLNGTMNIPVPIGSVSDGNLSLPISISYATGGLRPGNHFGVVGNGWSLNAGGVVTRETRGIPDDWKKDNGESGDGYFQNSTSSLSNISDSDIYAGERDGQQDLFHYSFNGISGSFVLDRYRSARLIPKSDIQVETLYEVPPNTVEGIVIVGFIITDTQGTKYTFRAAGRYKADDDVYSFRNAWYLTKIESFDGADKIELKYEAVSQYATRALQELIVTSHLGFLNYNYDTDKLNYEPEADEVSFTKGQEIIPHVTEIKTKNHTVTFSYSDREDQEGYVLDPNDNEVPRYGKKLDKIKFQNGGYCSEYDFNYSYSRGLPTLTEQRRLMLDSIYMQSCAGLERQPSYVFEYYNRRLPKVETKAIDHWGFYNAKHDNQDTDNIPNTTLNSVNYPGTADRTPDEESMKNGQLTKIRYPSGGSTEYTYEANTINKTTIARSQIINLDCSGTNTCERSFSVAESQLTCARLNVLAESLILTTGKTVTIDIFNDSNVRVGSITIELASDQEIGECSKSLQEMGVNQAGDYRLVITQSNLITSVTIDCESIVNTPEIVGGLRVKKVTTRDGIDDSNTILRTFDYEMRDGGSSGKLFRTPSYCYKTENDIYIFSSQSFSQLYSQHVGHISYTRVVEDLNGNGSMEYIQDEVVTEGYNDFPRVPDQIYPLNGVTKEVNTLDNNENTVQQTITTYDQNSQVRSSMTAENAEVKKIDFAASGHVMLRSSYYNQTTYPARPYSVTKTLDGVTSTTTYTYFASTDILSPKSMEMTNSDGKVHKTEYVYTHQMGNTIGAKLEEQNRLFPYKTIKTVNDTLVDETELTFGYLLFNVSDPDRKGEVVASDTGYGPYPYKTYRKEVTWLDGGLRQEDRALQSTIIRYHPTLRKPIVTQADGWEEKKITLDTQGRVLQRRFIDEVTSYTYKNNSTLQETVTQPDGTSMTYDYDALMRKKTVTDHCTGNSTTYDYGTGNPSTGGNYITTTAAITDGLGGIRTLITKKYVDGLGRPIQTILHGQGTTAQDDVITALKYDAQGRVSKVYEPKQFAGNGGAFKPLSSVTWDHTLTTYYQDPLSRKLSVTPPSWYTMYYYYGSNDSSDDADLTAGKYFKQVTQDGNGNTAITLTDLLGNTLRTSSADENQANRLTTKYAYDDKNRLTKVAPPGINLSDNTNIYFYQYWGDDLIRKKKLPDQTYAQHISYVYNRRGLLTHSRDPNLRAKSKFMTYNYDAYGRETKSGLTASGYPNNTTSNYAITDSELLSTAIYGESENEITFGKVLSSTSRVINPDGTLGITLSNSYTYDNCGRVHYAYGNNLLNTSTGSEVTEIIAYDGSDIVIDERYAHTVQGNLQTIRTERKVDHANRVYTYLHQYNNLPQQEISHTTYTEKGQVQTLSLGKTTNGYLQDIDYDYLSNGSLTQINDPLGTSGDIYHLALRYDADVLSVPAQKNGNIANTISQVRGGDEHVFAHTYDHHNRLLSAQYQGGTYTTGYTYDARGNITSIARQGMYASSQDGPLTTGTIDAITLAYTSPKSNRLSSTIDGATAAGDAGLPAGMTGSYVYDANGNITYNPVHDVTIAYNYMDLPSKITKGNGEEIHWTYDASGSKLRKKVILSDGTVTETDYIGPIEYTNKSLDQIHHEHGRLVRTQLCPDNVHVGGIRTGTDTYDATTITSDATLESQSDVVLQASNCILLQPGFEAKEGAELHARIRPCGSQGAAWEYQYAIMDHLGNTSVVFSDRNTDGTITPDEILSEYHYYPYGMEMQGAWSTRQDKSYKYTYNDNEHISELGLHFQDHGNRMLDPALGRWLQVDPQAESFYPLSPYNSMGNNPILYNDPDGDFIPQLVGGLVGGTVNLIDQALKGNVTSFGEGLAYFGTGALAGVAVSVGQVGLARGITVVGNKGIQFATGKFDPSGIDSWGDVAGLALDVGADLFSPGLTKAISKPITKSLIARGVANAIDDAVVAGGGDIIKHTLSKKAAEQLAKNGIEYQFAATFTDEFVVTASRIGGSNLGANIAAKGVTSVLGHYPEYVNLANKLNARRFNIPTKIWDKMTNAQRWTANQKFLDRMIARGDRIRLATPLNKVKPGSYYQRELNYLFDKGYRVRGNYLVK